MSEAREKLEGVMGSVPKRRPRLSPERKLVREVLKFRGAKKDFDARALREFNQGGPWTHLNRALKRLERAEGRFWERVEEYAKSLEGKGEGDED